MADGDERVGISEQVGITRNFRQIGEVNNLMSKLAQPILNRREDEIERLRPRANNFESVIHRQA